uniref:Peptidase S1 domain-containing protein n=2 Tax=Caenorhabditis japonica TaxID=281687 RepID=A0A8R1DH96_CAEJA
MFKLFAAVDCGYRKLCKEQKFTEIPIQKLILPEVCDDRQLDNDDFAIVELAENLKFNDRIKPICTAHDDWHLLEADVKMRLYGYGLNPANGKNAAGPLAYEDVFSKKCFSTMDKVFCIESLSGKQLACMVWCGFTTLGMLEICPADCSLAGY